MILKCEKQKDFTKLIKTTGKVTDNSPLFRIFALTITILYDLSRYEGTFQATQDEEGMQMKSMRIRELNLRDLGGTAFSGGVVPSGLYLRSGKLSILTENECADLCKKYHIGCVIDLRTPVEAAEFPDPLPNCVEYLQIPLIKDAAVGVTHETGSDPMTIIRNLRKNPDKLKEMVPDFKALYKDAVTDEYSRSQLDKAVSKLKDNAAKGVCTLFHCTAGKDRTGIVSMALLKSYGVSDEEIIRDYMRTNRNAFWPTIKKCLGVLMLTHNWELVKTCYTSFMAQRELIETAIKHYKTHCATRTFLP